MFASEPGETLGDSSFAILLMSKGSIPTKALSFSRFQAQNPVML
jgi:hypothetical protein